jgi:hypothetical protein
MPDQNPGHPDPSEYPPYASIYVDLVQSDDILRLLFEQIEDTIALLRSIGVERAGAFRYASDKWTAKQILGHVIDTERIFGYRALRVARNDGAPSPGFEQDDYVRFGPFDHCSLDSLVDEFRVIRAASLALYRNLQPEAWMRRGVANNFDVTVRGLAFLTAGHELHHAKILREKYLS